MKMNILNVTIHYTSNSSYLADGFFPYLTYIFACIFVDQQEHIKHTFQNEGRFMAVCLVTEELHSSLFLSSIRSVFINQQSLQSQSKRIYSRSLLTIFGNFLWNIKDYDVLGNFMLFKYQTHCHLLIKFIHSKSYDKH